MKARLIVVLVVLASMLAWAGPAGAATNDLHNVARAHTSFRHLDRQVLAWSQAEVTGRSLKAVNVARARATDCEGCTSEAVAFQVVLSSDTHIFVLTNTATAVNTECLTCTSVAVAEQWVVGATSGTVVLSAAGVAALAAVQAQLTTLVAQPPSSGLAGILEAADEVSAILASDVTITLPPAPVRPLFETPPVQVVPQVQHFSQVRTQL